MKKWIGLILLLFPLLISGCTSRTSMKDGFYTAEMAEYDKGWKEYLCILVKNDTVVYAEFNARNSSGFIKSWDGGYMENMLVNRGTYPTEYTRFYVAELREKQDPDAVDMLSNATSSGGNFLKLSAAVMEQALKGDSTIVVVE